MAVLLTINFLGEKDRWLFFAIIDDFSLTVNLT